MVFTAHIMFVRRLRARQTYPYRPSPTKESSGMRKLSDNGQLLPRTKLPRAKLLAKVDRAAIAMVSQISPFSSTGSRSSRQIAGFPEEDLTAKTLIA
jgi:hypothetical protein